MAQVVTSNADLIGLYKTWYTDEELQNLFFRNSPVGKKVKKIRIGGKEYKHAMLYGRGGAVSGDYAVASANASSNAKNAEMAVGPGKIFSVFTINQLEKLASLNKRGAYVPAAVEKMFAASEGMRKMYAACLYGSGYGEVGKMAAAAAQGATSMTVDQQASTVLDVGMKFQVTTTPAPDGVLAAGGPYEVTAIDGTTVTFTPAVVPAAGFIDKAYIEIDGGRDAGGLPNMPTGLAAIVPSYYNRGAAGGADLVAWNAYIATAFRGVTRSVSVDRLAGNFYLKGGAETYTAAITEGIRRVRRAGGNPDMIVLNDLDFKQVISEMEADRNYWQAINGSDKGTANEVAAGINQVSVIFSNSWVRTVWEDPYCPQGTAYILDMQSFAFISLSNTDVINDGITDNNPGAPAVSSASDQTDNPYKLIIDDYISISDGTKTSDGPAAEVCLSMYGNFVIHNPAHTCVVKFA